ncbi:MAG: cellulase family glycosylhydrolase [Kiritimatiellae bacterium]|nr:cellulase family glycosylhydrolase [Kiritimatiellia bacterium]
MNLLQTSNGKITDGKNEVRLRGAFIGGWMNTENWMNGYPGTDHELREMFAAELGAENASFFFERWMDHHFTEADVIFLRQCGANAVRIPFNYRHFEDDARPFHYIQKGFARLNQALGWCAKHGVYAVLDLHAVQGYQNHDWHSDNSTHHALLWQHPHFQDRLTALWEEFARRYADNPTVAGYNIMNEPASRPTRATPAPPPTPSNRPVLNAIYRRVAAAIRAIDPRHIIFLDGDEYSTVFDGLEAPFTDNLVYCFHAYIPPSIGRGAYPGKIDGRHWDKSAIREHTVQSQAYRFAARYNVPLHCGEFGVNLDVAPCERSDRLRGIDDQIAVLEELGISWATVNYKDIGDYFWLAPWIGIDPQSPYMRRVGPLLKVKASLRADTWFDPVAGVSPADQALRELAGMLSGPSDRAGSGTHEDLKRLLDGLPWHIAQSAHEHVEQLLLTAFARAFKGMTESQLDEALASFRHERCLVNRDWLAVLTKWMNEPWKRRPI